MASGAISIYDTRLAAISFIDVSVALLILLSRRRKAAKNWTKTVPPKPNRLMADIDATFVQKVFDIA